MKVNEILSATTIGSSRALSIFSASVIAVNWTGTSLETLPAIGSLKADEKTLAWMVFGVLIFMAVTHFVNWWNDTRSFESSQLRETFGYVNTNTNSQFLEIAKQASKKVKPDVEGTARNQRMKDSASAALASIDKVKISNWLVRNALHLAVPAALTVVAVGTLSRKLIVLYFPELQT